MFLLNLRPGLEYIFVGSGAVGFNENSSHFWHVKSSQLLSGDSFSSKKLFGYVPLRRKNTSGKRKRKKKNPKKNGGKQFEI